MKYNSSENSSQQYAYQVKVANQVQEESKSEDIFKSLPLDNSDIQQQQQQQQQPQQQLEDRPKTIKISNVKQRIINNYSHFYLMYLILTFMLVETLYCLYFQFEGRIYNQYLQEKNLNSNQFYGEDLFSQDFEQYQLQLEKNMEDQVQKQIKDGRYLLKKLVLEIVLLVLVNLEHRRKPFTKSIIKTASKVFVKTDPIQLKKPINVFEENKIEEIEEIQEQESEICVPREISEPKTVKKPREQQHVYPLKTVTKQGKCRVCEQQSEISSGLCKYCTCKKCGKKRRQQGAYCQKCLEQSSVDGNIVWRRSERNIGKRVAPK